MLLVAALGLPITDLWRYALLLGGGLAIFCGHIRLSPRLWLAVVVLVALPIAARLLFPLPLIEEGHNVFLVDTRVDAVQQGLPPEVYRIMAAEFAAEYPPKKSCKRDSIHGAWPVW